LLPFFTEPYPNELVYSMIARYHFYSGNIDCKDTLEEVFQNRSVIPSVEIGSHFDALAHQMGSAYSAEYLLAKHTVYPYYAPFLSEKRQGEILQDVKGDGKGLYTRLGIIAGSICRRKGLYYCPCCAKNDIEKYGEPYIHREHHLQGIDLCPHHGNHLRKYPVVLNTRSRIEFVRFEANKMDLHSIGDNSEEQQLRIAKMAYQLLISEIALSSREQTSSRYRALLRERNYITSANRVRQIDLYQDFNRVYSQKTLEKYESILIESDEYSWLKVLTRNIKRHVHPLRHLLFMDFLNVDFEALLNKNRDNGPFGEGQWPCLNKAASHYKKLVINKVIVSRDSKSGLPIGTFICGCEFVYSRKGPDKIRDDIYDIGRIKRLGSVWMAKLNTLAKEGYSLRGMAKKLDVDAKTIKKYLNQQIEGQNEPKATDTLTIQRYRNQLIEGIKAYPNQSRTGIRNLFPSVYMYLYRHDRDFLFFHLPTRRKGVAKGNNVNWKIRDNNYYNAIFNLNNELRKMEKPLRITRSLVGKRLGILTNLEKHIDKLPKTKILLEAVTESTQEFQVRRCCRIIDEHINQFNEVALWKVKRTGAVRSSHFAVIRPVLEEYISQKRKETKHEETSY
jgi:hypothetical protein